MKQRPRRYFTQSEMAEVWGRWERGESLNAIARDLGRYHSAVQGALARTGGIRPAPKRRSRLALTLSDREEISRGIAVGLTIRAIAAQLGRAPSTISREINRNGGRRRYRANVADDAAWQRAQRAKTCKLAQHPALARIVARRWPTTSASVWRPTSRFTSVIRNNRGNVDQTKTLTAYLGSTSRREWTCRTCIRTA